MSSRPWIYYTETESIVGPLTIAKTEKGICFIQYGSIKNSCYQMKARLKKLQSCSELTQKDEVFDEEVKQLTEYFQGTRQEFELKLDLMGTSFQKMVWQELMKIPYGQTETYKNIAKAIGAPKAVRAIGGANNQNPVPIIVPCHRVIGSNGAMVGYGSGIDIKETLLKHEGALEPTY
ncbi:methylated-DNA--[protein]-cysteine S-methyltransferase [Salisediminibacterium halotolerans]|uniref:Methylated-DNA--protein-cysteine methyltransferase n=1 Tax=Salisediminibacterium halotolerans TaxID=517425 RepID=A0A1H9TNF4_9BACI|nr:MULTISPECIES: methylated-DNA--[protein]-cysteine S-methyltransferase [Salisediminibacterium]RLJ72322.1 methylated-DNA-[protein]-cysteine S-methyltransferase [Actinophytocola xinjiangensis]RPE85536.1 methylated-DNA-[protein]-cysteine S-methyltransferase [Salisediminibacterium halotolerans]TWG33491.1 methylated-DNA-[protein]-cysteine S-methyltransferase [Salisediminibacterium halotolerans]SER98449.1 methylated-DNA-[protein]-cysteine S-methyltransferase [Salisediminibacterium haloalkalitolerans